MIRGIPRISGGNSGFQKGTRDSLEGMWIPWRECGFPGGNVDSLEGILQKKESFPAVESEQWFD
jgi:hypothetical protein